MARETEDGTIEAPEYRDEPWYENGTVDPETGEEQTVDGYIDHLQHIEDRAPIVVEQWSDLPANDPERVDTQTGQGRQRYVLSEDLLVYDDGEQWRALGGLGSEDRQLPSINASELSVGQLTSDVDAGQNDLNNVGAVQTGSASITDETRAEIQLGTSKTGNSAGSWVNAYDTTDGDNRGEINSSTQFVPDKTGDYRLNFSVRFGSVSSGDQLVVRIYNTDDSATPRGARRFFSTSAAGSTTVDMTAFVSLTAGKRYEIQAQDSDSTFDIQSDSTATYATIKWDLIQ